MVFSSITFVYAFFPLVAVAYSPEQKPRLPQRRSAARLAPVLFLGRAAAGPAAWCSQRHHLRPTAALPLLHVERSIRARRRLYSDRHQSSSLVGNLFVFKYLNFLCRTNSFLALFGWRALPKLTLPIGISFYTFQILSYVIDLYRGEDSPSSATFSTCSSTSASSRSCIAGPIVRYETVEQEILARREPIGRSRGRAVAALSSAWPKSCMLANQRRPQVAAIDLQPATPPTTAPRIYWLAAVAYALQIYFDFSGYSDMAIGLGRMFGFHFLRELRLPVYRPVHHGVLAAMAHIAVDTGSATMSISRSAATAFPGENPAGSAIFWSSGR